MNTNVWIPQNFNDNENLTIFKIWWIFHLLEGGLICFKLGAAKVICQHIFFYKLSYFVDNKLWNMIVLVHEKSW